MSSLQRPRYYDLDGSPLELMEWARLFELRSEPAGGWRIALDEGIGVCVSTVWLGLDHNYSPAGPPLIFETMIFGGEHDQYQERYSTKEEAIEGHKKACALAFGVVLVTYTLQVVAKAPTAGDARIYESTLRETEENLTDLLPDGYSVRIKEWSDG